MSGSGLTVVGKTEEIPQAEAQMQAIHPDLAVVDMMLPGVNGLEGTSRLKTLAPTLRVTLASNIDCSLLSLTELQLAVKRE